jgi:HK97 family phage prohead protease
MPEPIEIERRYVPSVVEPIELEERSAAAPVIKGISPPFNSKSEDLGNFREVFAPTAFDKVVGRHRNDPRGGVDVVALFDHEGQPIGRTTNDTLKLSIADRGLAYAISPPDTTLGRDIVTLVRRGDLFGASFAFSIAQGGESWTQEADGSAVRTISEVANLYDVSVVTRPAYPSSSAALRSLEAWRSENLTEAEQSHIAERVADEAADRRRRWHYALTSASARLVTARLKTNAPRIK